MTKKFNICASVEGSKLNFNTRQFFAKPPIINKILKRRVYPFKLGINGYVEIVTPLENAQQTIVNTKSLTGTGDAIQGGSIDGWTTKPIKPPVVKIATGTHSANFGSVRGHSYAHVESSPREHLQSEEIQTRHPAIIEIFNPTYK